MDTVICFQVAFADLGLESNTFGLVGADLFTVATVAVAMTGTLRPTLHGLLCHLNDGLCGVLQMLFGGGVEILCNSLRGVILKVQSVRSVLPSTESMT